MWTVSCFPHGPPCSKYDFEPEEGLRISRIQNELLAGMAQKYPDRISAIGTVPLQDVELAIKELRSLMQEPGLCGVEDRGLCAGCFCRR